MKTVCAILVGLLLIFLVGLCLERASHVCPEPEVALQSIMDTQRMLVDRGYNVKVDGIYGPATERALTEAYGNQCAAGYFPQEKEKDKYVIAWKSKATGKEGHGTTGYDLDTAKDICWKENSSYPSIEHFPLEKPCPNTK